MRRATICGRQAGRLTVQKIEAIPVGRVTESLAEMRLSSNTFLLTKAVPTVFSYLKRTRELCDSARRGDIDAGAEFRRDVKAVQTF